MLLFSREVQHRHKNRVSLKSSINNMRNINELRAWGSWPTVPRSARSSDNEHHEWMRCFREDIYDVHQEFKSKSHAFLLVSRDIYACKKSSTFTSVNCALQIKYLGHQRAKIYFYIMSSVACTHTGLEIEQHSHHNLFCAALAPSLHSWRLCLQVQSNPAVTLWLRSYSC